MRCWLLSWQITRSDIGHKLGFGEMFYQWLYASDPDPYGRFGNGSAMRVSSVGWFYDTLEKTREVARWTAEVTHNHPEGIKGAEATAATIFLARTGKSKDEIRDYIIAEFGYDLSLTCDQIRPWYKFDVSCQGTVPVAVTAFYEGKDPYLLRRGYKEAKQEDSKNFEHRKYKYVPQIRKTI